MRKEQIQLKGITIPVYSLNTIIVGSGAAGFNAADSLYELGQKDIAIVTEGVCCGTSRNTGSDKQTYYKLTQSGAVPDSVLDMAKTLFEGGAMHGDIALVEAALSTRCFYKLVDIKVPFPHNRYGEFVGYKTDHDPRQRATSAGPLTSRFMTERLEERVNSKGIQIFDRYQVIGILTHKLGDEIKAVGLIALNTNLSENTFNEYGLTLFNCTNIIYATGGPASIYEASVYPQMQFGATGIALEAGVRGVNLTESQYGIASTKFRWNLSGTYQQVLPRYISTEQDGSDEREFLDEYFTDKGKMLDAVFLKGYQWPFDPRKIENFGSSLIDILVYNETQIKGRRVFLDYTKNPSALFENGNIDFSSLGSEAYEYLDKSGAIFGTPVERLSKMNAPAIELYKAHGIDLYTEYLEIAVCAQHCNGGLLGNAWWESNVKHFFPAGEVNGSFGIYRPGGSALNSTQVGSLRASQFIAANYYESPRSIEAFINLSEGSIVKKINELNHLNRNLCSSSNVKKNRNTYKKRMTKYGAQIRSYSSAEKARKECEEDILAFMNNSCMESLAELPEVYRNWDILLTQYAFLSAQVEYISKGGGSRGSYLIYSENGKLPLPGLSNIFRYTLDNGKLRDFACEVELDFVNGRPDCKFYWNKVRGIPDDDQWFENVWSAYRKGDCFK